MAGRDEELEDILQNIEEAWAQLEALELHTKRR